MNIQKNQHWVPKFYLKHFATPETRGGKNPQVWIFDKETDSAPSLVNVKNVCAKRYLYSPIKGNGERDLLLEKKLGRLESALAKEWPSLANEFIYISKDDPLRKGISLFISTMILRHPDTRTELEDTHQKMIKLVNDVSDINDISAFELNGVEHKFDIDDWCKFKNRTKNNHHKFFTDYIQSNVIDIAEQLLKKRWSILFSEKPVFITSDKPVSICHLTKNNFMEDFGLGTSGSFVVFPISPNRILVMDDRHDEPPWQYYSPNDNCFGFYNLHIWRNSNRFMISSRDINEVLKEIVNEVDGD
jgi:hypothetical protein